MKERKEADYFYSECQRPSLLWLAFELILYIVYIYKYVIYIDKTMATILELFLSHSKIYSIFIPLIIILLPYCFSLKTTINNEGVYVRLTPFQIKYKFFDWNYIARIYIRKYKPFYEFGGWGKSKKAITMSGNRGIQLEFIDGKKLLIGTHHAQNVTFVLEKLKKFSEKDGGESKK
jgi:hypothetical protein